MVSSGGVLRGYISRGDVLDLYQQEILRHEYLGLNLHANGMNGGVFEHLRLPHEYTVKVMPVPPFLVGQTLREAQLRTRYRLTVVAVRRGGFARPDELPDPDWTRVRKIMWCWLATAGYATGTHRQSDVNGAAAPE